MQSLKLKSKIDIIDNKIEIQCYLKSDLTKLQVTTFLENLQDEYLNLSAGHIKFDVQTSNGRIAKNALIENEEKAGGQYVKHKYKVTEFIKEDATMEMQSPISKVTGKCFYISYNAEVQTTVKFSFLEKDIFYSILTLKFKNKISLISALIVQTHKIWKKHFGEEIFKGAEIISNK